MAIHSRSRTGHTHGVANQEVVVGNLRVEFESSCVIALESGSLLVRHPSASSSQPVTSFLSRRDGGGYVVGFWVGHELY